MPLPWTAKAGADNYDNKTDKKKIFHCSDYNVIREGGVVIARISGNTCSLVIKKNAGSFTRPEKIQ